MDKLQKIYYIIGIIQRIMKWDGVLASYIPLYEDQLFTLKTFKPITKEDIIKCTKYFVREILNSMIFNIKFTEEEKK